MENNCPLEPGWFVDKAAGAHAGLPRPESPPIKHDTHHTHPARLTPHRGSSPMLLQQRTNSTGCELHHARCTRTLYPNGSPSCTSGRRSFLETTVPEQEQGHGGRFS